MATCTAMVVISTTEPVSGAARIAVLDALRGFALLGILLMNSEFFARPLQGIALGLDARWQGVDRWAALGVATFVQGKFWTLFSLLFGVGFAVMLERAGENFDALLARRLAALALIGLVHAFFVWAGDILVPYAVAGGVLWMVTRWLPMGHWARAGLLVYFVPVAMMWASLLLVRFAPGEGDARALAAHVHRLHAGYEVAATIYAAGDWREVTQQRIDDSLAQYSALASIVPGVLCMFLLGAWSWRAGWLRDVGEYREVCKRVAFPALSLGVPMAIAAQAILLANDPMALTPPLALGITLQTLANLLLCVAYAAAFLWLAARPGSWLTALLAPAGRMSLSNYLAQSLVFTTLFYGYGVGLWGEVGRAAQIGGVLAFFALQVAWSHAWFARFRIGPVEWLWRAATWLQAPVMRR